MSTKRWPDDDHRDKSGHWSNLPTKSFLKSSKDRRIATSSQSTVLTNLGFCIPLTLDKSRLLVLHATAALPPFIVWP